MGMYCSQCGLRDSPREDIMTDTLQTSAPLQNLHVDTYTRAVHELISNVDEGRLDVEPPYQRPSVWSELQRRLLIKSFLVGLPVPALIINARWALRFDGDQGFNYALIDGKQRLETLLAWFHGELTIPASWIAAEDIETTVDTDDGAYIAYTGLAKVAANHMRMRWTLPTVEAKLTSIAEEAAMYGVVNTGGTVQTDDDIARAAAVAMGE